MYYLFFTLNSRYNDQTNYYSSNSIWTYYIQHRRGANKWRTYVSSPNILIFKEEINPSSSESIKVNMYRKAFFFISLYMFQESLFVLLFLKSICDWLFFDFFSSDFEYRYSPIEMFSLFWFFELLLIYGRCFYTLYIYLSSFYLFLYALILYQVILSANGLSFINLLETSLIQG